MGKAINIQFSISGVITDLDGKPLEGLEIIAFNKRSLGPDDQLGKATSDKEGKYNVVFGPNDYRPLESPADLPKVFIMIFSGNKLISQSTVASIQENKVELNLRVGKELLVDKSTDANAPTRSISGRIFLNNRVPASRMEIKVYTKSFDGDKLLGTTKTDEKGNYNLDYKDSLGPSLAFELRTTDSSGKEVPLMNTKFNAAEKEVMNLVAPATIKLTDPEYTRLMSSITPRLSGKRLGDAKEDDSRQDLSYLFQQTGWDTRLIGLAALADKRSVETGIQADVLYALFRTGLPTGIDQMVRVGDAGIEKALRKANEVGIANVNVEVSKKAIKSYATKYLRSAKTAGGIASVNDFLKGMNLPPEDENKLADLYFNQEYDRDEFWQKAKNAGISEPSIAKLKIQGKLSFLTLNNPALTAKLQQEMRTETDLESLALKGYYKPGTWKEDILKLAGNVKEKIADFIPLNFPGKDIDAKLDAYSKDMARKIRSSYPTHTLSSMIQNDDLMLGSDHKKIKNAVSKLLSNATAINTVEGKTFVPGNTSFHTYVATNSKELLKDIPPEQTQQAIDSAKTLTKLYQLAPSDESMQVLYDLGFSSALEVASISQKQWNKYYLPKFKTKKEGEVIYRKATQTKSMIYNFYTAAEQLNSSVPLPVSTQNPNERTVAKNEMIKRFPTLETLFGSLDFCECEHCRSVLSPSAYLVDILKFLDPDNAAWDRTKLLWKEQHSGTVYTGNKPYEVLKARRADIPNIPLNCQNTNTALPYIDIVNEIMECFVANQNMTTVAYDTGDITSEELLAEPQNIIPGAYDTLDNAIYPLNLPFDYSIELSRKLSDYFGIPYWKLLYSFRKTTDLFEGGPVAPYYMNDIFIEYLGLSAKEYDLFTAPDFPNWFKLYGYTTEQEAKNKSIDQVTLQRIDLLSAKTLSRKLGITYKELVALVKSHFLNPALDNLEILKTIGLSSEDVFRWKAVPGYQPFTQDEADAFQGKLTAATNPDFNATAWLTKFWNDNLFAKIILLFDTNTGGNFDDTTLQFADGTPLAPLDWVKLNLFVRLWKKLGWNIEELDNALVSFLPKDVSLTTTNFGDKFKTGLIYLSHLKYLNEFYPLAKYCLQNWTSIWGNIGQGSPSVYQRFFLSNNMNKEDPIYSHPLGKYLQFETSGVFSPFTWDLTKAENKTTGNVGLINHLASMQAALELSEDEIRLILTENNMQLETTPLSMSTVQLLIGFKVLREATKFGVANIISLEHLTGLAPLKTLKLSPIQSLSDDVPYTQTIRFLEIAAEVNDSGFSIQDLDYLARHKFDPLGEHAINERDIVDFIRILSQEIKRIHLEQSPPLDATGFTDAFLQERLLQALSPEVANTFISMWNDTIIVSATLPALLVDQLPANLIENNARIVLSYDKVQQTQTLSYTGVLDQVRLNDLNTILTALAAIPAGNVGHISGNQKTLAQSLLNAIQLQSKDFYKEHLFKPIFKEDPAYGFDQFFPLTDPAQSTAAQLATKEAKRLAVGKSALAFLENKFIDEIIISIVAAGFELDNSLAKYLLNDSNVISLDGKTLHDVYTHTNQEGVSIRFIKNEITGELAGPSIQRETARISATDVPPNTTVIVIEGYLEAQVAEAYRFFINGSKQNTKVKLRFSHLQQPLIDKTLANDNEEVSEFTMLEARVPYQFSFDIRDINGGEVRLIVQSESLPKGELSQLRIISQELVYKILQAHILLDKAVQVIKKFALVEKEVRYLVGNPTQYYQFSFIDLPLKFLDPNVPAEKQLMEKIFLQLLRLVLYAKQKKEMVGGSIELINLFESITDNLATTLTVTIQRFALLTRRDPVIVQQLVTYFGFTAKALAESETLSTIWDALKIVQNFGIASNSITPATEVVSKTKTHAQRFVLSTLFKQALKSKFPRDNWNKVAKSVFDKLRSQQRDTLAAYIMQKEKFDNIGQLFEFFLIDPGMEPVVQSSRIRLAISSVQTFVQRCLLNLEPDVSASVINRDHWEWMKRYRVWEANRKIFLFPENWLEPEFRDDKTHLFEELEGAVLQGDVNKELVESAFHEYLKGLEKIARLNMVAMYCEEDPVNLANNTIHVVGKAFSQPSYYYRTYRNKMWTPWVPIPDQIEGEHLALIKWHDRLHIFWLTFLPKTDSKLDDSTTMEAASKKNRTDLMNHKVEIQLNWCEYFKGEWRKRETGTFENAMKSDVSATFDTDNVYVHASIEYNQGIERAVRVHVNGEGISQAFRLVSKLANPKSSTTFYVDPTKPPYAFSKKGKTKYIGNGDLEVSYNVSITTIELNQDGSQSTSVTPLNIKKQLLKNTLSIGFLFCNDAIEVSGDPEIDSLISPFFFEDDEGSVTLYTEPDVVEKTTVTWEEWIIKEPVKSDKFDLDDFWNKIYVKPSVPYDVSMDFDKLINPAENIYLVDEIGDLVNPVLDWTLNPGTVVQFGNNFLGARGGVKLETIKGGTIPNTANKGAVVNVATGSDVSPGKNVLVTERSSAAQGNRYGVNSMLAAKVKSINVVGPNGVNVLSLNQLNTESPVGADF